jgi:hypothetical protein
MCGWLERRGVHFLKECWLEPVDRDCITTLILVEDKELVIALDD